MRSGRAKAVTQFLWSSRFTAQCCYRRDLYYAGTARCDGADVDGEIEGVVLTMGPAEYAHKHMEEMCAAREHGLDPRDITGTGSSSSRVFGATGLRRSSMVIAIECPVAIVPIASILG